MSMNINETSVLDLQSQIVSRKQCRCLLRLQKAEQCYDLSNLSRRFSSKHSSLNRDKEMTDILLISGQTMSRLRVNTDYINISVLH